MSAADSLIAGIAASQHGVVANRQLLAAGLGVDTIRRRIRDNRLHRLHAGVYSCGPPPLTARGRWMAAVLAGGDDAVLSHRSGAALLDIRTTSSVLTDVTVPGGSRRRRRDHLRLHTTVRLHPDDVTVRDGIPVTTVERTLLDLAEVVPPLQVRRAYERAERMRVLDHVKLRALGARSSGRRGLKVLLPLLAYDPTAATEAWSELERLFLDLVRRHHLPDYQRNAVVAGHPVDAYWPSARLIVELQGYEHHSGRDQFELDHAKRAAWMAAGYVVLPLTYRQVVDDPDGVAATLRALLGVSSRSEAGARGGAG